MTVILIFTLLWSYTIIQLFPKGLSLFEEELHDRIETEVEGGIKAFGWENGELNNVIELEKDMIGRVVSVKADSIRLNEICDKLEITLSDILVEGTDKPYIPIRAKIFSLIPFNLHLGGARVSEVNTSYTSKFTRNGDKATGVKISININVTYEYLLGEKTRLFEFDIWDEILSK